jgi:predicted metal-dependent hydrolase
MIPLLQKRWPPAAEVEIGGETVTIDVKVSSRAQSYRLSLPHGGRPMLTVPNYGSWREARDFLNRQIDWLAERLETSVKPVAFVRGAIVPLRGVDHRIIPTGRVRGVVEVSEHGGELALMVPGAPEHRARRLTDWLKDEALGDLQRRVKLHANYLGVTVAAISMRSQSTRWGSCSSSGKLNFNWRLVLAPPFVLDYVAAHEVAHLLEMNHSDKFWRVVERTLPNMERGREWLRINGRELMVYGLDPL